MMAERTRPFEILLVEDEPADAHLVRSALRECQGNCNLQHVTDGMEALASLRRQGRYSNALHPDLILLDLNMPRMSGSEFLRAAKADESLSGIPVVVLTTSSVERDIESAYRLGAAGFITKPADLNEFIATMRQVMSYWMTLTRLPMRD